MTSHFFLRHRLPLLAGVGAVGVSVAACLGSGSAPRPAAAQTATTGTITVTVNLTKNRRAINPLIYGSAYADDAAIRDLRLPAHRLGGNNTSRYNWHENADNRGNDWFYQSIGDDSPVAGERADTFIRKSRAGGAEPMLTVPILGHVAKLGANRAKKWSFSVTKYGAQERTDQWNPDSGNGVKPDGKPMTGNDPLDANIIADAAFMKPWLESLVQTHGGAASANGLRYYILDNEPAIWHSTHRDVHPVGARMDEVRDKSVATARMIKTVDPAALILGPEEWGWTGYFYSGYDSQWGSANGWSMLPDRLAHGNKDFSAWYLEEMKAAETVTGKRLLDVFTLHIYPQGGEFSEDVTTGMQQRRNRSTRALFDPAYRDETWINDTVRLIPRMKEWVSANYPGTQTGITEYNWGAEGHINGATTQADIYGIFGREGLDMAARWTTPKADSPVYAAMKLFRNYDGTGKGFGEVSVQAATVAPYESFTAYAAERRDASATTVLLVSKGVVETPGTQTVSVQIAGKSFAAKTAQVYQISAATPKGTITRLPDAAVSRTGAVRVTVPTPSVTLVVVPTGVLKVVK